MDDAPMLRTDKGKRDTTARWVLAAIAERADKNGANTFPSIFDIRYRTGFDRKTVREALRRLEAAGLIVRDGTVNGCTRWRLEMHLRRPASDRRELEEEDELDRTKGADRVRRHRAKTVTHSASVTVTPSDSVTEDVTPSDSVRNAVEGRYSTDVTPFKGVGNALSSPRTIHEPPLELTALESPGQNSSSIELEGQTLIDVTEGTEIVPAPRGPKPGTDEDPDWLKFWETYPKKVNKKDARLKWAAAVKRGIDPAVIVAAAEKWREYHQRAGTMRNFIKAPDRWLNGECWEDEITLPTPQRLDWPPAGQATTRRQQELDEQQAQRERQMARARARSAGL